MSNKRILKSTVRNAEELYKETFRKRGVNHIDHYPTPKLYHPEASDLRNIDTIKHIWKVGDGYSKLAYKFYGDPKLWWVIAWYNQLPTDAHVSFGDVIYIPTPLDEILSILRG